MSSGTQIAVSLVILTVIFQIAFVTAKLHSTTFLNNRSDQNIQLIPSSITNQTNSTITIIDNGTYDQNEDFASDIIALIFSTLSVLSTFTILILFYLEQSWVFGNEMGFTKKTWRDALNFSVMQVVVNNRVQQKRQVINKKKRQFIRRCMLALLIADLISSVSRILFILWWWVCSRVAPDVMFSRTLVPAVIPNETLSSGMNFITNHLSIQLESLPMKFPQPSTPLVADLLTFDNSSETNVTISTWIAVYNLKAGASIINRFFSHVNFSASLSTATWCVIVAFAIYATTTNVKWMEKELSDHSGMQSTNNSNNNSSFTNFQPEFNDSSTENSEMIDNIQDSSNLSENLISIDLRKSNQSNLNTSQLHQHNFHDISSFRTENKRKFDQSIDLDSSMPKRNSILIENLKKMSPFKRYEISFHIVAWGVGLLVFLVLFLFRFITTFVKTEKNVMTGFIVSIYISWNIYFTMTVFVNFIILIMIWRYVGRYINSTQLQVIPKKETKRRQLSVILRLSLLILPYVICGVFEVAFWYYNIVAILMDADDDRFILVFYNFFFNGLVPLRGFFFGIAFLLGSSEIRSFVKYTLFCGFCCNKKGNNSQLSESLLIEDPNNYRNFQALIVESSTDNLQSHIEHYNDQFREIRANSGSDKSTSSPNDGSSPLPNHDFYKGNNSGSTGKLRSGTMRPIPHNSSFNTIIQQQDDSNLEQVTFGRLDHGGNSSTYYQQPTMTTKKRARTFMPNNNTSSVGSPQSITSGSTNNSPVFPNSPRLLKQTSNVSGGSGDELEVSNDSHKLSEQ